MATSPPLSLRFSLCATLPPPAGLHCLYSDGLALSVYPPRNPLHALGELAATVLRSFTVRSLSAASPLSGAIALPRLSLPHASPDALYSHPRPVVRLECDTSPLQVPTRYHDPPSVTPPPPILPGLRPTSATSPYLRDITLPPRLHPTSATPP
ncbi:hypothetical protein C8F04DRAFT_1272040 [Mycena alexandri]|uniref:Uncharacterized protein n=1 Tax=Mycena alexandri TaxID=1745969 RepID=A0AAD6WQ50_9AGAR|nr:hypothetical protein C8F04DRAFT_1272040 [Mycena alexandri]